MAVNDVERQKAIALANYIHCSVHEWPTEDDVPLLCHALLHEVDQAGELRAQLAAAKQHAEYQDKEIRQWANVCYVGTWPLSEEDTKNTGFYGRMAAKMTAERNAAIARAEKAGAERDALAARVAELERALEEWKKFAWAMATKRITQYDKGWNNGIAACVDHFERISSAALTRTPAQSLAKVQAAALREAAGTLGVQAPIRTSQYDDFGSGKEKAWEDCVELLESMASRLEAEAANG